MLHFLESKHTLLCTFVRTFPFLLCSETPHNTQEPVPALSGETAHYSASDDCCCWSILWPRGREGEKPHSLLFVGQCKTKHSSFFMRNKRSGCHRAEQKTQAAIHVDGWEEVYLTGQSEISWVWQGLIQERNVMKEVITDTLFSVVSKRIYSTVDMMTCQSPAGTWQNDSKSTQKLFGQYK